MGRGLPAHSGAGADEPRAMQCGVLLPTPSGAGTDEPRAMQCGVLRPTPSGAGTGEPRAQQCGVLDAEYTSADMLRASCMMAHAS
eukprot:15452269-Alexandrium_andersonii.AAC.1